MRMADRRQERKERHRWHREALQVQRSLTCVHGVARRRLQPGTVVWAHVPYEENEGWKLRPAVVVACHSHHVEVHAISGALSRLGRHGYLEIDDLEPAGLDRPCAINLNRLIAVDHAELISRVGDLSTNDYLRLQVTAALLPFVDPVSRRRIR